VSPSLPRDRHPHARADLLVILLTVGLAAIALAGCGGAADARTDDPAAVVEETGSIDAGDRRDPDHADLPYDAYTFDAAAGDTAVVNVDAKGFVPLLKLVEVASGAVLAEWEAEYSDDEALTYSIAGPGTYEARVYALENGSGSYTLSVRVSP
jgi:hypothetical protein